MKKILTLPVIAAFLLLSGQAVFPQTDSTVAAKGASPLWYFTFGAGVNTRGFNVALNLTVTSPGGLGGTISLNSGFMALQNVPPDYYDGFLRFATPTDDYTAVSILFLKKFSSPSQSVRIGFGMGPSFIKFNLVTLVLNPDYPGLFEYKYNKVHEIKNTTGFHPSIITEATFSRYFSADFTIFGDFNSIKNIVGFDICMNVGFVRKK